MGNRGNRTARRNIERGECQGWSRRAANSNADFLESVDWHAIEQDDQALLIAASLTTRTCPESAQDWQAGVHALNEALNRLGCWARHHVTEWTKAQRPHLHGMFLFRFAEPFKVVSVTVAGIKTELNTRHETEHRLSRDIESAWLRIANARGWDVLPVAQSVKPATGAVGWADYLTKHGSRSVSNYQRDSANIPEGWQGKTGRMWARSRTGWPVVPEERTDLEPDERVLMRRAARRFERSRAQQALTRAQADVKRHLARKAKGPGYWSEHTEKQVHQRLKSALAWIRSTRRLDQPRPLSDKDRAYWLKVKVHGRGLDASKPGDRAIIHRRRNAFLGSRASLSRGGQDRLLVYVQTRPQQDEYHRKAEQRRTHTAYRLKPDHAA